MTTAWGQTLLRYLVALAVMFAALSAVPPDAQAAGKAGTVQAAQKLAGEAKAAYMARDYDKAVELFAEALRNFEHPNLHFTHGRSLEHLSRFSEAAAAFARAGALSTEAAGRTVADARAVANRKLDEAQQLLSDSQAALARVSARAAHTVLVGQAKRAEDGEVYPEPASVLLLLARIEFALGNAAGAQTLLAEVAADPTAAPKVAERAAQMAANPRGGVAEPVPTPKPEPRDKTAVEPKAAELEPRTTPREPGVVAPAPAKGRPVAALAALGVSAAVTVAGTAWYAMASSSAADLQTKLNAAKQSGKPVDGLDQQAYTTAKADADRGYKVGSALAIGGGVALAASVAWLVLAGDGTEQPKVALAPVPGGWTAAWVVAW